MDNITNPNKPVWTANQLKAIEVLAYDGLGKTKEEIAEMVGVRRETIWQWQKNPAFNQAVYDRFMELAEKDLPEVVAATFREAKKGNVQAQKLILEHFGKFRPGLDLSTSDSPFKQFIDGAD